MKSPARRFVTVMLGLTALLVGGAALLNYVVDPYDRHGNNRLGVYISAEREVKATEVGRHPHNALLVGNSRMAMIPPKDLKGFRFFNGAFAGAMPDEIYWFLHRHANRQELVVLGIDLGMKDPQTTKGDIFRPPPWDDVLENLVSLKTLQYSWRTIFLHATGKPSRWSPDGAFDHRPWVKWANRDDAPGALAQREGMKRAWGSFVPSPASEMSFYRKISDTLRERGITCVVIVPPMDGESVLQFGAAKLQAQYSPWLDQVKAIFPHVIDLSSGPYATPANFYRSDPNHFTPETGVQFMNEVVIPAAKEALRERAK